MTPCKDARRRIGKTRTQGRAVKEDLVTVFLRGHLQPRVTDRRHSACTLRTPRCPLRTGMTDMMEARMVIGTPEHHSAMSTMHTISLRARVTITEAQEAQGGQVVLPTSMHSLHTARAAHSIST